MFKPSAKTIICASHCYPDDTGDTQYRIAAYGFDPNAEYRQALELLSEE